MVRAEERTVLVVDDEPNVRDYLAQILRDAGFQVVTAGDGVEALEKIREAPPDFISLDLVMPRKSGHRLLLELRRNLEWSRIPVLVVTAHAHDELGAGDLDDIMQGVVVSGPQAYLEKPVRPIDYVRCVQRALGIPESEANDERQRLEQALKEQSTAAGPQALRRALEALRRG